MCEHAVIGQESTPEIQLRGEKYNDYEMHIYILITLTEALVFPRIFILASKVTLTNNFNRSEPQDLCASLNVLSV